MKEINEALSLKLNYAIVFRGRVEDIQRLVQIIKDNLRGCSVVFSKTSGNKLFVIESGVGGDD